LVLAPAPPSPRRRYSYPELAAAVIQKLEVMPALEGLATVVQGAEELPYLKTGLSHIKGPFVRVRFEYRRKRGNPYETYQIAQQEKRHLHHPTNPDNGDLLRGLTAHETTRNPRTATPLRVSKPPLPLSEFYCIVSRPGALSGEFRYARRTNSHPGPGRP